MSSAAGTVDARATSWASANPAANVDYSTVGGSSVTATGSMWRNIHVPVMKQR